MDCSSINDNNKIRVGFLVQMPSLWDKQVDIYLEAKKRSDVETFLFVVPEDDWSDYHIENDYDNNYFVSQYPEAIKIHDSNGEIIDLKKWELDYLFYPRPYDIHLPEELRSYNTCIYVLCCYVPYGFTASDTFNEGNLYNPFFKFIYFCFMDSPYMKRLFDDYYIEYVSRGIKRIEYLGYPTLEKYLKMGDSNSFNRITWTPRWSYDPKLGGSNFLEYMISFIELERRHMGKTVFRPHPLMFEELVKKNMLSEEEVHKFLNILRDDDVIVDIDSPIDEVLVETDVLISDFSTILGTFFLTGRPIIYCDKGIPLNEVYSGMARYMYVANNWEEVEKWYDRVVIQKDDFLKTERLKYISEHYGNEINSSSRIIDALIDDSGKGGKK